MKINSKGQALVLFIVFIPFILVLGTFIIDISYSKYNLNNLNNVNKEVIRYGLKHIDENPKDNMIDLINKNIDNITDYNININTTDKKINVTLIKSQEGIFGKVIGKKIYKEKSSYIGKIVNNKIIIEGN